MTTRYHDRLSAAAYAGCDATTIDKARRAGLLRGYRRGGRGRWVYAIEDLDRWIRGEEATPDEL